MVCVCSSPRLKPLQRSHRAPQGPLQDLPIVCVFVQPDPQLRGHQDSRLERTRDLVNGAFDRSFIHAAFAGTAMVPDGCEAERRARRVIRRMAGDGSNSA